MQTLLSLGQSCLQLSGIATALGNSPKFCKAILRNISPGRCWLCSRLEIAFPLLEIPPGVSDGECTTSLSISSCLSHILITEELCYTPEVATCQEFEAEPVGAVAVRVWMDAVVLELWLSSSLGPSCSTPPSPLPSLAQSLGPRMEFGFIFHPLHE